MRSIGVLACIAASAGLAAQPLTAQDDPADAIDTPEVIDKLFECRAIGDPEARLACFDREVAEVFEAQQSRDLVIADREKVTEAKRGLFGLKLPKITLFGDDDEDDEINEITATLAEARRLSNGRYIFELEDGARWIQTEYNIGRKRFKKGDTIVIKRAAFGSFKARVDDKVAGRVKRLN